MILLRKFYALPSRGGVFRKVRKRRRMPDAVTRVVRSLVAGLRVVKSLRQTNYGGLTKNKAVCKPTSLSRDRTEHPGYLASFERFGNWSIGLRVSRISRNCNFYIIREISPWPKQQIFPHPQFFTFWTFEKGFVILFVFEWRPRTDVTKQDNFLEISARNVLLHAFYQGAICYAFINKINLTPS